MTEPVLVVRGLNLDIRRGKSLIPILRDVSFELLPGHFTGIAGESGAGKSMTMYCLTALLPRHTCEVRGEILFREADGSYTDIMKLSWARRQPYCAGKVSLILQDAIDALNPFERIERQWGDTIRRHGRRADREALIQTMETFGIPGSAETLGKYPHQLSGGMRQRIAIAMALESEGSILIADEPTTSLDTINQRRVVEYIVKLARERGLSMLYITHNLGIVRSVCDEMIVMRDGRIVEQGGVDQLFSNPAEAYTRQLIEGTRSLRR